MDEMMTLVHLRKEDAKHQKGELKENKKLLKISSRQSRARESPFSSLQPPNDEQTL